MSVRGRLGLDPSQFRITPGALALALGELAVSLLWLASPPTVRATLDTWLAATPSNVFEHGRVWTLVTGAFLELNFLSIILHMIILWSFVPTLERFWGTARFLRFAAITSVAATVAGTVFGRFVTGDNVVIGGLNPFVDAAIVAFGITYARQPVQFFGVLPLTGRQLMYGILGVVAVGVLLQGDWNNGVAFAAACGAAALMTSKWSPMLAWKRRKIARARAKLSVMQGGKSGPSGRSAPSKPKRDDSRFLN